MTAAWLVMCARMACANLYFLFSPQNMIGFDSRGQLAKDGLCVCVCVHAYISPHMILINDTCRASLTAGLPSADG